VETFRDISQEKELNRLRADWDAFIRHELKNPLNPILALSGELLRSDYQMEYFHQDVEFIHQNARKLARLLEQTREVQLYESGKLTLNHIPYDLVRTIQQAAVQAGEAVTTNPGVWKGPGKPAWNLQTEADLDTVILHDPENLARVFQNLMQNAWEHHPGEVTVQLSSPAESWLRAVVHNQGEPIPPQRLASIFEKYNTTKQDLGGSGLGTTIAKVLVEAHGGTIGASSSWERGTEFTINLPRGSREV
jgi:signal transduction histidine kinase